MKRLLIAAIAGVIALASPAVAQQEVDCNKMQSEIANRQHSLSGLSDFLGNTDGYGLLVCNPTFSRDKCLEEPEAIATWADTESGDYYVLFPQEYIIGFAQDEGIPAEDVQMIFARNDGISHIIRSAGGVENLQAEIGVLQAEYARVCGGG